MRDGNWMQAGAYAYWPNDPRSEEVDINVIARALSKICRYGGHVKNDEVYSVAEHSVLVSELVPLEHALQALMHDSAEAYCNDIVRPIKVNLTGYKELEEKNWRAICQRFDLNPEIHQSVHDADVAMLFAEQHVVLEPLAPGQPNDWGMGLSTPLIADPGRIKLLPPYAARQLFLDRFKYLMGRRARG